MNKKAAYVCAMTDLSADIEKLRGDGLMVATKITNLMQAADAYIEECEERGNRYKTAYDRLFVASTRAWAVIKQLSKMMRAMS